MNSYDAERIYNERFIAMEFAQQGHPDIVYALPYPWDHIYGVELAGVDPKEG